MSVRTSVTFDDSAYKVLQDLAARRGTTIAEVLRDAIALERWVDETKRDGGTLLVERDGKAREVEIIR